MVEDLHKDKLLSQRYLFRVLNMAVLLKVKIVLMDSLALKMFQNAINVEQDTNPTIIVSTNILTNIDT